MTQHRDQGHGRACGEPTAARPPASPRTRSSATPTLSSALRRPGAARRRHRVAGRSAPGRRFSNFGFGFLDDRGLEPGHRELRRAGADLRHPVTSVIAMLIGVPVSFGIAIFLTELCPRLAAPADRHRGRAARRHPPIIYGIWGLFVFAPFLQRTVQPSDRHARRRAGLGHLFAGPPYGIGIFTAGLDPRDHGAALHRRDHPRRLRDRAAVLQGIGLRPGLHDLGGGLQGRHPLHARRRHRRHHAGPRPRARRDHGGHLRDRQRAPHLRLDPARRAPRSRRPSPTSSPRRSATSTPRR